MEIAGNVFVVTGGGNGIGRAVVLDLLARGAGVAAVDVSEAALAETAALAGNAGLFSTHVVDLADRDAVEALPEAVVAAHGQVDGVLNVAGIIQRFVPVNDLSYEEVEKVMAVNYWGVVHMCKAFLPHLLERPAASIVNVGSMGGLSPVPGQSAYGASKAAVKLFTEGLYAELLDTPVAVTVVFPGAIATNISANSGIGQARDVSETGGSAMRMTTAQEAARQIVAAVEKGSYRATIGNDARMVDLLSRLMPRRTTEMITKKMGAMLQSMAPSTT
ncbi:Short-chain dehydrogenase [Georgenia satyanarayanai]|uniref:Short-chain dehydrogenase n=1 Tax=Georgenia satyanarayanai TaxID=860221 RepID=A0A2Y9APZ2_9MICO|nr:SDR family oxidoreductase [Georgenia satyanarayanai]PYF97355.1 short-subunit dehydrogenase [Georgenia satyanarayanai]SSA46136.1 Short-chain dehydrogenase [Georgenia satyanarayanai]